MEGGAVMSDDYPGEGGRTDWMFNDTSPDENETESWPDLFGAAMATILFGKGQDNDDAA
jgi:hypothetical protein